MDTLVIFELTEEMAMKSIGEEFVNKTGHPLYTVLRGEDYIGNIVWTTDIDSWAFLTDEPIALAVWEVQQLDYFMKDLMIKEKGDMN